MELGQSFDDREIAATAEIQGAAAQSLPDLRSAAGLPAQVWHVPDLLSAAFPPGRDSRHYEVELVDEVLSAE